MPASRSVVGILCLVFLLFVAASRIASATHFIGGTQHWVNDLAYNDPNNIKVRVTFEGGYRWSYPWPGGANPPVGTTIVDPVSTLTVDGLGYHVQPIVTLLVIGVVPGEDELYASGFVDLIIPRSAFPVSVQYSGCCRVSQLVEGNNDQPYVLKMVVDPTMGTRSPRSLALPRMSLVYGLTSTFPLPSASFDNLVNTFSFAPSIDSGLVRPIPGNLFGYPMQLTAAGMVTWRPQLSGRFGAQFRITSVDTNFNQKSAVPVDMEFAVVAAPAQTYPPFFEPGTPASLSAPAGQNVSFTISASSNTAPTNYVTLVSAPLPPGATFTQAAAVPNTTTQGLFSWTPTLADVPGVAVCFQAIETLPSFPSLVLTSANMQCVTMNVVAGATCEAGSFSPTGYAPCTLAPVGTFVSGTGSTSATFCPAGTFSNLIGAAFCNPAPAGSFAGGTGNVAATLCPAGYFSSANGATACAAAPAGSFATGPGAISATECAPGSFSASAGSGACNLAPAGSFAVGPGATSTALCPAGTFSAAGAAACTQAPAGSYAIGPGATAATQCSAGSYSGVTGATTCTAAPAGSYVNAMGSTAPTQCSAGFYSGVTGATACIAAPTGSYVGSAGSTSATLCPAGTFSGTAGASACTPAPAGSYASGTGNTAATLCPAGTTSAVGASACTSGAQLISEQIDAALSADPGLASSFHQQANAVSSAPNANAKAGKLQAFINHVNAQRGKALTPAQADNLIALAMLL